MKWSVGRGKYGPVDDVLDTSWDDFAAILADAAQICCAPEAKHGHWWCAPFLRYAGSVKRRIDDVERMADWLGLDLDHGNTDLLTIKYHLFGMSFVAYTTARSQPDDQRWRLLIRLDRENSPAEHRRLLRYYASKFEVDHTVWNCNRIFYLPAQWHSDSVFYSQPGQPVSVDSILALVPEEPVITTPPPAASAASAAATRPAPDGTGIVTAHMLQAAQQAPQGGRCYRLMCQAAKRYRLQGWELDASVLAAAAMQASALFAPGKKRPHIVREAGRAIDWAAGHCSPLSPMEKMRNRILWENRRFK